jgi:hypothetical protein
MGLFQVLDAMVTQQVPLASQLSEYSLQIWLQAALPSCASGLLKDERLKPAKRASFTIRRLDIYAAKLYRLPVHMRY